MLDASRRHRSGAVTVSLLVIALAACAGEAGSTTVAAGTGTHTGCVEVDPSVGVALGVDEPLGAVHAFEPDPAVGEGDVAGDGWVVATADGAAWLTFFDPSGTEFGFVAPINAEAVEISELGADIGADAPILRGLTGDAPVVNAAVDCAAG